MTTRMSSDPAPRRLFPSSAAAAVLAGCVALSGKKSSKLVIVIVITIATIAVTMVCSSGRCFHRHDRFRFPGVAGPAHARLDPVDRPDLLPKDFTTIIDIAGCVE